MRHTDNQGHGSHTCRFHSRDWHWHTVEYCHTQQWRLIADDIDDAMNNSLGRKGGDLFNDYSWDRQTTWTGMVFTCFHFKETHTSPPLMEISKLWHRQILNSINDEIKKSLSLREFTSKLKSTFLDYSANACFCFCCWCAVFYFILNTWFIINFLIHIEFHSQ